MTEADFSGYRSVYPSVAYTIHIPIHSSQHGKYLVEHTGVKLTDIASGQSTAQNIECRSNKQNDYMDEHRRRHGRRMDYEEKK